MVIPGILVDSDSTILIFTGGSRYMHKSKHAMAYYKYLLTSLSVQIGLKSETVYSKARSPRHIVAQVFRYKIKQTLLMIKSQMITGRPRASIEWQK